MSSFLDFLSSAGRQSQTKHSNIAYFCFYNLPAAACRLRITTRSGSIVRHSQNGKRDSTTLSTRKGRYRVSGREDEGLNHGGMDLVLHSSSSELTDMQAIQGYRGHHIDGRGNCSTSDEDHAKQLQTTPEYRSKPITTMTRVRLRLKIW